MTCEKTVPAILREAADLIEVNGLSVGRRKDEFGRYCAHGAIAYAATGDECCDLYAPSSGYGQYEVAWRAVGAHLGASNGRNYPNGIAVWSNTSPKHVVVRELRETADELENQECGAVPAVERELCDA